MVSRRFPQEVEQKTRAIQKKSSEIQDGKILYLVFLLTQQNTTPQQQK